MAPLCAGAGPLACRGLCRSRRWGRGGTWRAGLSPFPPWALRLSRGVGVLSLAFVGGRGPALRGPCPASRGPDGGERGGEGGGGGRAVAPCHPPPGGWPVAPGPGPPSWLAGWRRASFPAACWDGAVWQHRAPGAVWPAAGGSVRRGGGGGGRAPLAQLALHNMCLVSCYCFAISSFLLTYSGKSEPLSLGRGALRGEGRGGCSALARLSAPPGARTNAGCFIIAPASSLHWLTSTCRRPGAACRVPLRAGAGLPACCGYCGSGRAADWGHAAYSSAYRGSGAPPWVLRPSRGGGSPPGPSGGGAGPPSPWPASDCQSVGGGEGGGGEGDGSPLSPSGPL